MQYRRIVLEQLLERPTVQRRDVFAAVRTRMGTDLPQAAYVRLIRELAVKRNNAWALKSGLDDDVDDSGTKADVNGAPR